MNDATSVAVIGTGYVGMACAISLSEQAFVVAGHDINHERIIALQQGATPYKEDDLEAALALQLQSGRLSFTTDLSEAVQSADIVIICVNTPTTESGHANLDDIESVFTALQACELVNNPFVAIRSTVPPGTSDRFARMLGGRARIVMTPEFLREGRALADSRRPSRHIVGAETARIAEAFAQEMRLADAPILLTTRVNAELTKLAANSFLAMKITFANEVANLAESFNGDVHDVLMGIGMDQRIGSSFLQPGIGFGGPCLTKDLKSYEAVAARQRVGSKLVSATLAANALQPERVIAKLERELGTLRNTVIGVWGLTFKAGTDDVRYSLTQGVIAELTARGAHVRVYDPKAAESILPAETTRVASALAAVEADALLVLTEWPEFANVSVSEVASRLRRHVIVDGRNILSGTSYAAHGVRYFGVGVTQLPITELPVQTYADPPAEVQYAV